MPKLDRIVIGVDFSEPAQSAVRWVIDHFAGDAEIVLVHVVNLPQPPAFLRGRFSSHEQQIETAVRGAEARLSEFAALLGRPGIQVEVRAGRPAEQLGAVATEEHADLLIVGEHGDRPGIWNMLGSTAEHLVRTSHIPVMLARGLPSGKPKRILAPIDQSDYRHPVLQWATFLGSRLESEVFAFHSLSTSLYGYLRLTSSARKAEEVEQDYALQAREWLVEEIRKAGLASKCKATDVVWGDPSYEILAAAKRMDADLVVVGGRGAGAISHALLGSVARAVLRGASGSVLIVPLAEDEASPN